MAPPDWAVRLVHAGRGLLFLDELSTAPPPPSRLPAVPCRGYPAGWRRRHGPARGLRQGAARQHSPGCHRRADRRTDALARPATTLRTVVGLFRRHKPAQTWDEVDPDYVPVPPPDWARVVVKGDRR